MHGWEHSHRGTLRKRKKDNRTKGRTQTDVKKPKSSPCTLQGRNVSNSEAGKNRRGGKKKKENVKNPKEKKTIEGDPH